jgi:transposase
MTIVGGFDVHRQQITFDYAENDGLVRWGQIRPRHGSPQLPWAASEAAKCAARRGFPDHAYYHKLAAKHDGHNGKNPTLAVERKILRRCYHTLRELGDAALALPDTPPQEVAA